MEDILNRSPFFYYIDSKPYAIGNGKLSRCKHLIEEAPAYRFWSYVATDIGADKVYPIWKISNTEEEKLLRDIFVAAAPWATGLCENEAITYKESMEFLKHLSDSEKVKLKKQMDIVDKCRQYF